MKSKLSEIQELKALAEAYSFSRLKADKRIQVKMPDAVVSALDKAFPHIDRSKLLTQLALEALLNQHRFTNPELRQLVDHEQTDLDTMWEYLDERET